MDCFLGTGALNVERQRFLDVLNFNKSVVRAKDAYLYTDDGKQILDFTSQYGAVPFGHNPDFLWDVLCQQREQSPGIMIQPLQSQAAVALADALVQIAPGTHRHVTFAQSGAEAVEAAIKMVRARTGRHKILSTLNGFHGKTMASSLVTGNHYYREPFLCRTDDFDHIPFDDLSALEKALSSGEYAAFFVEPVQGEGGMVTPAPGYLKACENLCHQYQTLLVVDEIQTGLGRTGALFACQHDDVQPDIIVIAKALGGGMLPISACIASPRAWSKDFGQRHSSTFANNHLTASIGLAVLRKLQDEPAILANVRELGAYLTAQLDQLVRDFPAAFRARSGVGFMQGIALADWQSEDSYFPGYVAELGQAVPVVASYLLNRHQIFTAPTLNASNVLRIQPNYLITREQIDRLIHALRDVGQLISEGRFSAFLNTIMGLGSRRHLMDMLQLPERTPAAAEPKGEKRGTFAFFIHPTTDTDLIEGMPGGVAAYDEQDIPRILDWSARLKKVNYLAAPSYYLPCCPSRDGGYVDGWLISSLLTPREMMRLNKDEKAELLASYMRAAQAVGATMVGLGAFTSVISRSGAMVTDFGLPVTTGNAYTALTSTDSVRQICTATGRPLASQHLGILGVKGSVGRLALLDLAPECGRISLIGNPRNKGNVESLEVVAGELLVQVLTDTQFQGLPLYANLAQTGIDPRHLQIDDTAPGSADYFAKVYRRIKHVYELNEGACPRFPLVLSNQVEQALAQCDVVITATSNGEAFIQPDCLKVNAIVCDVARPSDVAGEVQAVRPDVIAYEGGLVQLPADLRFGRPNVVGLPAGISLACLSETMILALAGVDRHYSVGGNSSLDEARQVFRWATAFGFLTHVPVFARTAINAAQPATLS
jgi:acetylornithine/succinyldiaminopimelate/putrescine aminotransferase/predicted amino acid dehydrogenase